MRTFGIEFETVTPEDSLQAMGVARHGYHNTMAPKYSLGGQAQWRCERDGSLVDVMATCHGDETPTSYMGIEFVSPVLAGDDGLSEVVATLDYLNSRLAASDLDRCATHIHVGINDFSPEQVDALVRMFVRHEKAFFALCGDQATYRWQNTYCRASHEWKGSWSDYDQIVRRFMQRGHDAGTASQAAKAELRYRSLNLENYRLYERKKTVEFRLFASELAPEVVLTYLYVCLTFVNFVRENHEAIMRMRKARIEDTWQAVESLASLIFANPDHRAFFADQAPDEILEVWGILTDEAIKAGLDDA